MDTGSTKSVLDAVEFGIKFLLWAVVLLGLLLVAAVIMIVVLWRV